MVEQLKTKMISYGLTPKRLIGKVLFTIEDYKHRTFELFQISLAKTIKLILKNLSSLNYNQVLDKEMCSNIISEQLLAFMEKQKYLIKNIKLVLKSNDQMQKDPSLKFKVAEEITNPDYRIQEQSEIQTEPSPQPDIQNYRRYTWGGRVHDFPEDFELPQANCMQMWRMWLYGNKMAGVLPYRFLRGKYMKPVQRIRLTKLKAVMEAVRERIGLSYDEIIALGDHESERCFNRACSDIMET